MGSKYQHGQTYDFFLSYSTRDLAWVRTFHDDLIVDVNRFAECDVFPFLDKARLQPGHVWDTALLNAVADSAILVPVFSPRFFDSDYCQKEVSAFVATQQIDSKGLASGKPVRSRIVPVKLLSAAPADHILAPIQAQSFYADRDGIPYEYALGSPEYREALRRMAYSIAQTLKELLPKSQRPAVYVASDFKPHSQKLRASLAHHYEVLPEKPEDLLGLSADDLELALERYFNRCFASVHVVTESPFASALIDKQLEFAKTSTKPRLAWTPGRGAGDLANAGFECNFSSQADLEDRIRQIFERPLESKPNGERLIYFLCSDRMNKLRAESFLHELENLGIWTFPSPLEGLAEQAMQTHVKALDELDGCLIYYGEVDREWFDATFLRIQKTIRKRRIPSAIYPAPPPTAHKQDDLRTIGIPVLDFPSEQEAAQAFANLLSQSQVAPQSI
jgi:hypothetical protein